MSSATRANHQASLADRATRRVPSRRKLGIIVAIAITQVSEISVFQRGTTASIVDNVSLEIILPRQHFITQRWSARSHSCIFEKRVQDWLREIIKAITQCSLYVFLFNCSVCKYRVCSSRAILFLRSDKFMTVERKTARERSLRVQRLYYSLKLRRERSRSICHMQLRNVRAGEVGVFLPTGLDLQSIAIARMDNELA